MSSERDEDGFLPLHAAILQRDFITTQTLLDRGDRDLPFALTASGDAPIHLAAACCRLDEGPSRGSATTIIPLLLERMSAARPGAKLAELANLRRATDQATPLHVACLAGALGAVSALLATTAADVCALTSGEMNPLAAVLCDKKSRGLCTAFHELVAVGLVDWRARHPLFAPICFPCGRRVGDGDFPIRRCERCRFTACAACFPQWSSTRVAHFAIAVLLANSGALDRSPRPQPIVLTELGPYKYSRSTVLGRGARGVTYECPGSETKSPAAALKIIEADVDPADLAEGMAIWSSLPDDLHVARLLDFDAAARYVATEYCDCGDLRQLMNERRALADCEASVLARQLCTALRCLEAARVVHRAVTPENVLLRSADGKFCVRLSDLGDARRLPPGCDAYLGPCKSVSRYTAPEVLREGRASLASDLWSLGAIVYELVEGEPAYRRRGAEALLDEIRSRPAPRPRRAAAGGGCLRLLGGLLSPLDEGARARAVGEAQTGWLLGGARAAFEAYGLCAFLAYSRSGVIRSQLQAAPAAVPEAELAVYVRLLGECARELARTAAAERCCCRSGDREVVLLREKLSPRALGAALAVALSGRRPAEGQLPPAPPATVGSPMGGLASALLGGAMTLDALAADPRAAPRPDDPPRALETFV